MKSLKALTEHLRSLQLINDDAFDSWVDDGHLEPGGTAYTCGLEPTRILYRLVYVAVFSFEGWHGSAGRDAYFLFAVILQWLDGIGYDYDRDGFPRFDVEFLDDETSDVEIRIKFQDAVYGDYSGGVPVIIPEPVPDVADQVGVDHA